MRRLFYFMYILVMLPAWCSAQQESDHYRDSLVRILNQNTSDSIKARASFLLANDWSYTDTVRSKEYLEQGKSLSGDNSFLNALFCFYTAQLLFETDKLKAERTYLQVDSLLAVFKTKEAYLFRAKAWHNYGVLHQLKDDEKMMLTVLINKAIPLVILSGNKRYLAQNYSDVGVIFMNQVQYEKAEIYYNKSIEILKILPESNPNDIYIYTDATNNLLYMNKLSAAKKLLDETKTMVVVGKESEFVYRINEGIYSRKKKQYRNSLNALDRALKIAMQLKNAYYIESAMFLKYKSYEAMGKYEQAKDVLLHIVNNRTLRLDQNSLMHYHGLAEAYLKLGDMKSAYTWLERYSNLSDSLSNSRLRNEINALEIKFRSAEKEKKIVTLQAKNQQAGLAAKNSRLLNWQLASASFLLLIVALFSLLFYRNNKKLFVQKELNHQQQLKELEQQQQIVVGQALLQGEEQERRRLARDLHDGLGGMLAGVKINLSGLETNGSSMQLESELHKIIGQLDNSVTELRHVAHNMMPMALIKFGLQTALKDLCESLISDATQIDFQSFDIQQDIPEQTQVTIYRIIQELLLNAIRHGQAHTIVLQCSQNDHTFFITHEDDGKGFDPDSIDTVKGIGLSNIRSRVSFLKGKMEIESAPNKGTIVNIELHVE